MEINRRQLLRAGTLGFVASVLTSTSSLVVTSTPLLRIALLHLAPIPSDLAHNRRLADAYSPGIARSLKAQGAQLLVSSAAWAAGIHGPNGEWEQCSRDTGLALLVCNRTGPDRTLNFTDAESVIVKNGRFLSFQAERSTVFTIDRDLGTQSLDTQQYQRIDL
jgi:hypothetical protein